MFHPEGNKQVGEVNGLYLPSVGRTRLAREVFGGRFRPAEIIKLREIAAEYQLERKAVLQAFVEFQAMGVVKLSGNISAIVRSPDLEEMEKAYEVRAAIEEVAGRTAATVLKGFTTELRHQLEWMRAAADEGDLDACAEHDVAFHRAIIKASQNDVLLRTWDALAVDLRIRAVIGTLSNCLSDIVESHQLILEALENGQRKEAGLLLRRHIESSLVHMTRRHKENAPARAYRGGLGGARLRRVTEFAQAKIEDELSIVELAECAGLSASHFSKMFHQSTGESPHQFLLRLRVERAKEMLRSREGRVLDVAVACGFKTQQHFAQVFRKVCGVSPTEYRFEVLR